MNPTPARTRATVSHGSILMLSPVKSGLGHTQSNLTPLSRTRTMTLTCPICCLRFHRPPSHAARVNVNYCSVACRNEGSKVRVESHCVVCGGVMFLTPSLSARLSTCSKRCSTLRRLKRNNPSPKSLAAGKKTIESIRQRGSCCRCGANHGPWMVRGLKTVFVDGVPEIDDSNGELWCNRCFWPWAARLGGDENRMRIVRENMSKAHLHLKVPAREGPK